MKLRLPDPIKPLGALSHCAADGAIVTVATAIMPHLHLHLTRS
jgi:hypothetical protein